MTITRRCPICDAITSMEVNEQVMEARQNKKYISGVEDIFYTKGTCRECQDIIYKTKKRR